MPDGPRRPSAAPLAGLHVAFCAFEGFPNKKGSGTRIGEVTRALAAGGARVTLITLRGNDERLPPGVEHRVIRLQERNYLARALAFRDATGRALTALRPDVVHFRGPWEGQAALAYAHGNGGPRRALSIFEVNGLPSVELRYHYPGVRTALGFEGRLRALERDLLERADAVLTQSRSTARFLGLRGLPPGVAHVIPNGADPALFSAPKAPRAPGPVRLLYAGSLAPWQGLQDLLLATKRSARRADLVLEAIGPAKKTWTRSLSRLVRRLKLADRVTFTDALSRPELAARVQQADLCVAPLPRDLRNRGQGCSPIKLFEYMAAGRCVLSTDLPCLREIIGHDDDGWLARPSHPHRLSEAIVKLAEDEALRDRLGARARDGVVRERTWAHRHVAVRQTYERLLS